MNLILKDELKEKDVERVFGKAKGPRKSRWLRTLYAHRNNICPECEKQWCICKDRYEGLRSDAYSRLPSVQEMMAQIRKKK